MTTVISNGSHSDHVPPAIEVENLTVSYGPVPALLDVSLSIAPGQLVNVIDPNRSGKSTLIKTILGFIRPDLGSVRLFGEPAERAKGRVAYVPQRGAVDWDFPITVREVAMMSATVACPSGGTSGEPIEISRRRP